jgi:hypothetical protein
MKFLKAVEDFFLIQSPRIWRGMNTTCRKGSMKLDDRVEFLVHVTDKVSETGTGEGREENR